MKLKQMIVMGVTMLAFSIVATVNGHAALFTNTVSITATALTQGSTNDNGRITSTSTVKNSITTKQLLVWLAQDEHAEGNFPSSTVFPTGAILVVIIDSSNPNNADFQVLTKGDAFLVDVSDILSLEHGPDSVASAKISDSTGLLSPNGTQTRLLDLTFDDTPLIGIGFVNLQFSLSGVEAKTVSDSTPRNGAYTESVSAKVTSATGEGSINNESFIVTGSYSFTSKAVIPFP